MPALLSPEARKCALRLWGEVWGFVHVGICHFSLMGTLVVHAPNDGS